MLVEECQNPAYARSDETFYWLLSNLWSRLASNLEVENRAQSKWPRDKLTKSAADANMVELRQHVGEALEELKVLHHPGCTPKQACKAWDWVFRSEGFFEAYDKDPEKTKALFSKVALIHAGVASTNRFGVIVQTGMGAAVSNPAHAFYGDVRKQRCRTVS